MSNNLIEQKKNTHLYFQVGKNKYAVNTTNVLEIMKLPALDYPQKLPNNIIGLLKYNNFVINIIDLRFYLNIDVSPYNTHNELLIVKTDEVILGIITDKIIGILPFDTALVDQIPFVDNKMVIESIYKHNNETIFIVNVYALENLFSFTKKNRISQIAEIAMSPTEIQVCLKAKHAVPNANTKPMKIAIAFKVELCTVLLILFKVFFFIFLSPCLLLCCPY